MDTLDEYLQAYSEQKRIEAELAVAKQNTANAKMQLIAYYTAENLDSARRGDRTVTLSWRSYPKVVDFDTLVGWVEQQDEPRSEFLEEAFRKGSKKDPRGLFGMIHDAQMRSLDEGKPLHECLPPGLEIAVVPVVTVRSAPKPAGAQPKTALDRYDSIHTEDF